MTLISNWKGAWRMFSVQSMALAGILQGTWMALPASLISSVPGWLASTLTLSILVLGIFGRLVSQPSVPD